MLPLWDKLGKRRATPITATLLVLILGVFLGQLALMVLTPEIAGDWLQRFALVPERWIRAWTTWEAWIPVLSSAFLHGGPAHVLGNAWFLWVFGRSLEEHIGGARFLLIYMFGAVAAGLAQVASDPGSEVPMVGASGAISAVMGAYFVRLPTRWIVSLVPWVVPVLPVPAFVFLVLWFALQVTQGMDTLGSTSGGGGVAWWAHAGGFVAGALVVWLLGQKKMAGSKSRRRKKG